MSRVRIKRKFKCWPANDVDSSVKFDCRWEYSRRMHRSDHGPSAIHLSLSGRIHLSIPSATSNLTKLVIMRNEETNSSSWQSSLLSLNSISELKLTHFSQGRSIRSHLLHGENRRLRTLNWSIRSSQVLRLGLLFMLGQEEMSKCSIR